MRSEGLAKMKFNVQALTFNVLFTKIIFHEISINPLPMEMGVAKPKFCVVLDI